MKAKPKKLGELTLDLKLRSKSFEKELDRLIAKVKLLKKECAGVRLPI